MIPPEDQVRQAAYDRWLRRGGGHGRHLDDWLAAEQELFLAANYRLVAHYRLDGDAAPLLGRGRTVCRYCEQAPPRTSFSGPSRPLPESLGNRCLFVADECDECRALFGAAVEGELEAFVRACLAGAAPASVPVAALKGLTRLALALTPLDDLDAYPDAVEWLLNPDNARDRGALAGLGLDLHVAPVPHPSPWAALYRRSDADAPLPYLLACLGLAGLTFALGVPLGLRDDAGDRGRLPVPKVAAEPGSRPAAHEAHCTFVPVG